GGDCTITNTLKSAQFTVSKNFSDDSGATVNFNLSCSSGTVTLNNLDATEASPAVFTVTGYEDGTTCTATEPTVPQGYDESETACDSVDLVLTGACTITNTLRSTGFTVDKDYSPGGNPDPVTIYLECDSGTVAVNNLLAYDSLPAAFTVNGYENGTTC